MSLLDEKLKKLEELHPKRIDLTLDRVLRLLEKLGNPHLRLPPIIHVAGTNGKGSTVAFMRAMAEAAGLRVHAYTSPHLIRFNERIRLKGELVSDQELLNVFDEIETVNAGEPITFFEITTVAAFVLFARMPADLLLLEVGLGGRLDATNVITPKVCVITRISIDHTEFLGDTLEKIATEKAGIMKPRVPCVIGYQKSDAVLSVLRARARELNAPLHEYGTDYSAAELPDGFQYCDKIYPLPALLGAHQIQNAAAAITALKLFLPQLADDHIATGLKTVDWPGRLQRITSGKLVEMLPEGAELWYDGAHNDSGAEALAEQCRRWQSEGAEIHLILGMLKTKNPAVFAHMLQIATSATIIPVTGSDISWNKEELATQCQKFTSIKINAAKDAATAIAQIQNPISADGGRFLICGSLYLADSFLGGLAAN